MQWLRAIAQQAKGAAINKAHEESMDKVTVFIVSFVANNQAYKGNIWSVALNLLKKKRRMLYL
jgi:hypothetical protein